MVAFPRFIAPLVFSLALAGCASREIVRLYSGPALPPEKIAVIVVEERLETIDGTAYRNPGKTAAALPLAEVLPGTHTVRYRVFTGRPADTQMIGSLRVTTSGTTSWETYVLTFEAEPGYRYHLCTETTQDEPRKSSPAMCRVQGVTPSLSSAMTSTPVKTRVEQVR